jgi:hypothetical protein
VAAVEALKTKQTIGKKRATEVLSTGQKVICVDATHPDIEINDEAPPKKGAVYTSRDRSRANQGDMMKMACS